MGEARASADALTANRQLDLKREQQNLQGELIRLTRIEVFAIAKKTLRDLADVQFGVCATRVFIERLRSLHDDVKNLFSDAIKNSKNAMLIRTAFELPDTQRAELQQAINVFFSADVSLTFEVAPNAVGGIELSVQGQTLAWTIENYLGRLEQGITDMVAASNSKPALAENAPNTIAVTEKK